MKTGNEMLFVKFCQSVLVLSNYISIFEDTQNDQPLTISLLEMRDHTKKTLSGKFWIFTQSIIEHKSHLDQVYAPYGL
jgi:hypothetical protein